MAKVKLGSNPKNFTKKVEIVLLDGSAGEIEINYRYRTRSQFAALLDEGIAANMASTKEVQKQADARAESSSDAAVSKVPTVAEIYAAADGGLADFVMKIADGWDLDDEFNKASLLRLEDENPGALQAISDIYRSAVAEARAKN